MQRTHQRARSSDAGSRSARFRRQRADESIELLQHGLLAQPVLHVEDELLDVGGGPRKQAFQPLEWGRMVDVEGRRRRTPKLEHHVLERHGHRLRLSRLICLACS